MSNSGRYTFKHGDRTFVIEPIDNTLGKSRELHGDIDPVTKKMSRSYGNKSVGAIHEDDSIITKENGFNDIHMLRPGESPEAFIRSHYPG